MDAVKASASLHPFLHVITGLPQPVIKLTASLFGSYALSFVYRKCVMNRSPWLQHLYFTISGLAIAFFCFGPGCVHSLVNVFIAFLVLRLGGPTMTTVLVMFTFNLVYLVTGYACMSVDDSLHFHWTTTHCILCLRLTGLGWDFYDGSQKDLSDDYKTTAITKAPSLHQVLGYVYFYGGFLVGPQFSFKRYLVFVEGDLKESRKHDPTCVSAGMQRLGLGALYALAFLTLDPYFNAEYLLTDGYQSRPLLIKYLYVAMFGKVGFMKYIALFLLAEGSCVLSGLSFNGMDKNGNLKWDGTCYVKLMEYETSYSCQHIINSFNVPTNVWIRRYLFKRLRSRGKSRTVSYLASLFFLAIWHGVDVGFFVAFVLQFLLMNVEKQAERLWQMVFPNKGFREVPSYIGLPSIALCLVYRHVVFPFGFAPFVLLSWPKIYQFYVSTCYVPLLIFPVWMALYPLMLTLVKRIAGTHEKKA